MAKETKTNQEAIADSEYNRLVGIYKSANVDEVKLQVNDSLIRKVAEIFAVLEAIKSLPTVIFDPKNPLVQKETAAGKIRVKYMAQYSSAMQKLNKDMLGTLNGDDDEGLDDYE